MVLGGAASMLTPNDEAALGTAEATALMADKIRGTKILMEARENEIKGLPSGANRDRVMAVFEREKAMVEVCPRCCIST